MSGEAQAPMARRPGAGVTVCFAVKEEAKAFRDAAAALPQVRVLLTGMGRHNAERAMRAALDKESPRLVVSSGFAGGLNPDLNHGAVVFSTESDAALQAALQRAGAKPARFHCAEQVASSAEQKKALRAATGADAVEMESEAIAKLCRERAVPCATIRVILDTANEDLPLNFNQLMTPDQRLAPGKLALALARAPGKIPALLRLQRQSAAAAERLAEVLQRFLSEVEQKA